MSPPTSGKQNEEEEMVHVGSLDDFVPAPGHGRDGILMLEVHPAAHKVFPIPCTFETALPCGREHVVVENCELCSGNLSICGI